MIIEISLSIYVSDLSKLNSNNYLISTKIRFITIIENTSEESYNC